LLRQLRQIWVGYFKLRFEVVKTARYGYARRGDVSPPCMVKRCQFWGAWRGSHSYKEVAKTANAKEVNKSSLELDANKHKDNRIVQVEAFEEDIKNLSESYVGETYAIDQVPSLQDQFHIEGY
ncbi:hypothetical protein Ancab_028912, partial [Ancistrocladus abbreviatus]